jgi:hypothetical protein
MLKPHKLSPIALLGAVGFLVIGELLTGTSIYFVSIMALTMLCIGVTFNVLGGLSSIGGIGFASFALNTIVISQFAKVILGEAADKNIEVPQLTILVYMVFCFCVMLGTFVFGRIRLKLPKALEMVTEAQTSKMYVISLLLGTLAYLIMALYEASSAGEQAASKDIYLGLGSLLYFAVILGVESRIRSTDGLHSFGIKAFIPCSIIWLSGLIGTSRAGMVAPALAYALTCYVNGFRFRRKHYLAALVGIVALVSVVSPFELYARQFREGLSFKEEVQMVFNQLTEMPAWAVVKEASQSAQDAGGGRSSYYDRPGTFVLSRLSLIRADSNLIYACSGGYHYGFVALKNDLLMMIPAFLYKDKPTTPSTGIIGHVSGMTSDEMDNNFSTVTAVGDSFGAFGWMGVVLTGLIAFPTAFVVYESMFDMSRPWGTVALAIFCARLPGAILGSLAALTIRGSIELVLLSYVVGGFVRMIPTKGKSRRNLS